MSEERESGTHIGNYYCNAEEVEGKKECGSSDALGVYAKEDEEGNVYYDAHCYSCKQSNPCIEIILH